MKKKKLEDKLSRTRKKLSKAEAKISELEAALQTKSNPQAAAAPDIITPSPSRPAAKRQVKA